MVMGLISQSCPLVPSRGFGGRQTEVFWIRFVFLGFFKLVEFSENGAPSDHGELIAAAG